LALLLPAEASVKTADPKAKQDKLPCREVMPAFRCGAFSCGSRCGTATRLPLAPSPQNRRKTREWKPMSNDQGRTVKAGPSSPACSLREACSRAGLDRNGERCPTCPVRDLCQSEVRWLVKALPLQ
jgi:hypothetical protein